MTSECFWILSESRNSSDCRGCIFADFLGVAVFCWKKHVQTEVGAIKCADRTERLAWLKSEEVRRVQLVG